jgi:hypothetical protein
MLPTAALAHAITRLDIFFRQNQNKNKKRKEIVSQV